MKTPIQNIEQRVKSIIAETLDINESDVETETHLVDDLGCDSLVLVLVELVLEAEDVFEIDIPDEDVEDLETVQQCVDYIAKRLRADEAA